MCPPQGKFMQYARAAQPSTPKRTRTTRRPSLRDKTHRWAAWYSPEPGALHHLYYCTACGIVVAELTAKGMIESVSFLLSKTLTRGLVNQMFAPSLIWTHLVQKQNISISGGHTRTPWSARPPERSSPRGRKRQ